MLSLAVCVATTAALAEIAIDGPPPVAPRKPVPKVAAGAANPSGMGQYAAPDNKDMGVLVPEGLDVLDFINGDKLHGMLECVVPEEEGIRWKHGAVKRAIEFSTEGVSLVKLARRQANAHRAHEAVVELTNGDSLCGDIVSLDGTNLVLDTWYAGKMKIKRVMVASLDPSITTSSVLYEGPVDIANWTFGVLGGGRGWQLRDGALYTRTPVPIGRNIENFPDDADIGFDVSWRGSPYFYFTFYTDNLKQYSGNCYALRVSSSSMYLYRYSQNMGSQNLGSVSIRQFTHDGNNRARFALLVNKAKREFSVTINGSLVRKWTDSKEFAGRGTGILFQPQNQGELKVSNISIAKWDGKAPSQASDEKAIEEDLIHFVNRDKVSGTLMSIVDSKASFKTPYTTLPIPLPRIERVDLSPKSLERARRNSGDIRGHFVDRGTITLRLTSIVDGRVEGFSENFGDISMPLGALRLIELNIYEEKSSEDEWMF